MYVYTESPSSELYSTVARQPKEAGSEKRKKIWTSTGPCLDLKKSAPPSGGAREIGTLADNRGWTKESA